MKVTVIYRNDPDRPLSDPLLDEGGPSRFVHRVYSGDLLDPLFGNWFTPPWPKVVIRLTMKRAHFFSWRLRLWKWRGKRTVWCGYAGFKLYGADSSAYLNWMPMGCVFNGSQALSFSLRPFAFRSETE